MRFKMVSLSLADTSPVAEIQFHYRGPVHEQVVNFHKKHGDVIMVRIIDTIRTQYYQCLDMFTISH